MNRIKLLKKYIIDSEIYVSLMGALLAAFFMLEQNTFRFPTFFLLFFTYLGGYLYTKYQYSKKWGHILVICMVSGVVCAVLIINNHHIERLYKWMVICILGLLYNSFFLKINIRKIPLFKIFYVGLIWGLINAWLSMPQFNWPIFLISFLYITALVLPFDIRDMKNDRVLTFPQIIGVGNTKILSATLVVSSMVLAYLFLQSHYGTAFILAGFFTLPFIYFSENSRPDAYFSFGVESCSGFPLMFYFIIHFIQNFIV